MPVSFVGPGNSDPASHIGIFLNSLIPNEADLTVAALWLHGEIRTRTLRDESLLGGNFIPYSEGYAKQKGQQNVDLHSKDRQSHMLEALVARVTTEPLAIQVGIYGNTELATRAQIHNEGGLVRTRQGTGKHVLTSGKFAGLGISRQKKGGHAFFTMPRRDWLGARIADLDTMRRLILNSIYQRVVR